MGENGSGGAGRTVLIVFGVLGGLGLLCCGGSAVYSWVAVNRVRDELMQKSTEERLRWAEELASDVSRSVVGTDDATLFAFLDDIAAERDDAAYARYTATLAAAQSREQFGTQADVVRAQYGAVRSSRLRTANRNIRIGQPNALTLGYRVTFGSGEADLTAELHESDGSWEIASWNLGVLQPLRDADGPDAPDEDAPEVTPEDDGTDTQPGDEPK